MSHHANTEWLEAAHENFEQALEDRNWGLAEAVIMDTQEAGFSEEANRWHLKLTHRKFHGSNYEQKLAETIVDAAEDLKG